MLLHFLAERFLRVEAAPTLLAKLRKATEATQEELSQSQNALSHFLALKDRRDTSEHHLLKTLSIFTVLCLCLL